MAQQARKQIPNLEHIESNERFATAAAILRALQAGLAGIERERDALRIEDYLGQSRLREDPRADVLRARLKQLRGPAPSAPQSSPAAANVPPAVHAALELLRAGTRPPRRDLQRALEQLVEDADIVHAAILAQQAIVDSLKDELSADVSRQCKSAHRELLLAQYRAAQLLAVATDAERELRRSVTGAGYTFRDDLLPAPMLRSALILGSENEFDSEIARVRRQLEEWKVLT
jgi:hypothetical protein